MAKKTPDKESTSDSGTDSSSVSSAETVAKSRELVKRLPVIGYVTWLCSQSQGHRQLFVQDLEWRIFPPILLGQYKLHVDKKAGGLPTAYASWAFLSQDVESSYRAAHKLRPGDWKSGDRLWLVDFVTPFGGAGPLLEELHYQIHEEREIRLLYPGPDGKPVETTLSELVQRRSRDGSSGTSDDSGDMTRH